MLRTAQILFKQVADGIHFRPTGGKDADETV
jgi:hypothetical protein